MVDLTPFPAFMSAAAFHALLRKYKDAGFVDRILFGTDSGPEDIPRIVAAYASADFLSREELGGILCGNAERFLALRGVCGCLHRHSRAPSTD
jgi:predicted TIM-barrel fold metal-dependent hydrolase